MRGERAQPAMFPEDESLPPNNPEMMLFMAVLLIGCPAGFLSRAAAAAAPLAVH